MQETTQPSIARRSIPGSIDVTGDLVQYAAGIYNEARFVILNAGEWLDHFATYTGDHLTQYSHADVTTPAPRPRETDIV